MLQSIYNFGKERFIDSRENITSFGFLNNVVPVLMGLYIFINPFPHMTAIKEICFYLAFFLVGALILFKKIKFSFQIPLFIPFCLFVCWVFVGLFFALDKGNSIHDFNAHLLRYIMVYFILINVFSSRKRFMALSRIIIVSSISYCILGISYFYFVLGNSWATRFSYGAAKGLLGYEVSGNSLCALVIFSILLTLSLFKKGTFRHDVLLALCLIPQIVFVFLVQSRGAYIALFLSLIVFLWKSKKILLAVLILLVVITTMSPIKTRIAMDTFVSDYRRTGTMFTILEVVKDFPIMGIGFGNETYGKKVDLKIYNNRVPEKYRLRDNLIVAAPHNILLNILVRTGFVGLALFLSILFVFVRMCWRCARGGEDDFVKKWGFCIFSAFLSFFVIGMFEQMFHHVTELIFYTILAMGSILWRMNDNMRDAVTSGISDR